MNPTPDLRDIHLPEAISWWPPASGWWIIAALLILAICLTLLWLARRHRRLSVQRLALRELEQIEHHCQNADNACFIEAISALLRRVAISVGPRSEAAGLTGQQWLRHLDELAGEPYFNNDLGQRLIQAAYQADPDIDTDALLKTSRSWILQISRRDRHA